MSAERSDVRTSARPAMGATARITTDASTVAVAAAHTVIARLESRWSRFLPTSELSAVNRASGPRVVQPATAQVIEAALAGCRLTDGWYDPRCGRDLEAAGYDRPLSEGWSPRRFRRARTADRAAVHLDPVTGLLDVPTGVALDLGGVAKGWAADAAAELLADHGAVHAGVEVGGDVRIRSRHRAVVDVAHPGGDAHPMRIGLRDGGVAVSGPMRRRAADGRHHLIDPHTGEPAAQPRLSVVIAASAAGAEMLATAAAIAPLDTAVGIVTRLGATAWLVDDGSVTEVGTPERFLLDPGWLRHGAPLPPAAPRG